MIYVTHDQREALTMSDRVAVMNAGKIIQIDTPRKLYSSPADHFVAGFVGESTLVPVVRTDPRHVRLGGVTLRTPRDVLDGELFIALQSESILLCDGSETETDSNYLEGTVRDVVFQGESLKVPVILPEGTEIGFRIPSHHYSNHALPRPGEAVRLKLHIEDTVVVSRNAN
jgi:putative spermidine/putrescine transport system ATP-binding protein